MNKKNAEDLAWTACEEKLSEEWTSGDHVYGSIKSFIEWLYNNGYKVVKKKSV